MNIQRDVVEFGLQTMHGNCILVLFSSNKCMYHMIKHDKIVVIRFVMYCKIHNDKIILHVA